MAVEHQAQAAALALQDAHGVRPSDFGLPSNRLQPIGCKPIHDELGQRLLLAGWAGDVGERAAELPELVAIDLRQNPLSGIVVYRHDFIRKLLR